MDNESYIIEVVEWLEKAARTSDNHDIAMAFANEVKRTCKQISHDYTKVRETGYSDLYLLAARLPDPRRHRAQRHRYVEPQGVPPDDPPGANQGRGPEARH